LSDHIHYHYHDHTAVCHRKQFDANPRYRAENILTNELDMSEKTTQEFAGPDMRSRVDQILAMDLAGDDGEDISFGGGADPIPSPYLSYTNDGSATVGGSVAADDRSVAAPRSSSRPKTGKRRDNGTKEGSAGGGNSSGSGSQSSRPKSAARRRDGDSSSSSASNANRYQDDYKSSGGGRYIADEDQYPTARGLIKK
jgi:hypothetical protein